MKAKTHCWGNQHTTHHSQRCEHYRQPSILVKVYERVTDVITLGKKKSHRGNDETSHRHNVGNTLSIFLFDLLVKCGKLVITLLIGTIRILCTALWSLTKYLWPRGLDVVTKAAITAVVMYFIGSMGWHWLTTNFVSAYSTKIVTETVVKEVPIPEETAPVLKRIARCESSNQHFRKDGSVRRGDQDRDDIGRWQVNTRYWGAEAKRLGLNVFNERENELMARWIYANHGTWPWDASKACWK